MHAQNSHTTVNDIHTVKCRDISNRSAATDINFTKFCGLECNFTVIKNLAYFCHIFCIRIVGTGFSSCSCKFIKNDTTAKVCCIFLFETLSVSRVIACTYIGRKHKGITECSAKCKVRIASHSPKKFCNCILKEFRLHTGCANASNLLFIRQKTAACAFRCFHFHQRNERSVCAYAIILSVCCNHTAVKATVTGFSCRNDLKLCRKEIFFLYIIFLFQDAKYIVFDCFFFRLIFFIFERSATDQNIKILALNYFCCFFLKLLACKMDQKISDVYDRIILIFTNCHIDHSTIFFDNHTMDCERQCNPVIFLYTAIIMGIKICEICIFI